MKLICQQCNHENEVERIYCHNCGAKLDRSSLPVEDPNAKKKKKRLGPSPLQIFLEKAKQVLTVTLASAMLAAIICIFIPVSDTPDVPVEARDNAPFISTDLEGLLATPTAASKVYSELQINAFLAESLKLRKSDRSDIKLTGGFVQLTPNRVRVVGRVLVFGVGTGFQQTWEVSETDYPAKPKLVGARLGCMPIPTFASEYIIAELAKPFWKRLDGETKYLKELGAKIEKEKVTFFTKK